MTCDYCKSKIERGEAYSITELGRLHAGCQRASAVGFLRGPRPDGVGGIPLDPVYVLHRA